MDRKMIFKYFNYLIDTAEKMKEYVKFSEGEQLMEQEVNLQKDLKTFKERLWESKGIDLELVEKIQALTLELPASDAEKRGFFLLRFGAKRNASGKMKAEDNLMALQEFINTLSHLKLELGNFSFPDGQ